MSLCYCCLNRYLFEYCCLNGFDHGPFIQIVFATVTYWKVAGF